MRSSSQKTRRSLGSSSVDQRPVNMFVDALVLRIDTVLVVRGLQQIAVAEHLDCELLRFTERGSPVVVVADHQYRYASAVERYLKRCGRELVVERAGFGEEDALHYCQQWQHFLDGGVKDWSVIQLSGAIELRVQDPLVQAIDV